jgi:hypothetical protein
MEIDLRLLLMIIPKILSERDTDAQIVVVWVKYSTLRSVLFSDDQILK